MSRRSLVGAVAGALALALVLVLVARVTGGGGREDAYCAQAAVLASADAPAVLEQFDLDDPDGNADAMRNTVRQLGALRDTAPDDIAGDAELVARTTGEIVDALTDLEADPTGARARLEDLREGYDAFVAASGRLVSDVQERCGVTLLEQQATPTTVAPTTVPG